MTTERRESRLPNLSVGENQQPPTLEKKNGTELIKPTVGKQPKPKEISFSKPGEIPPFSFE